MTTLLLTTDEAASELRVGKTTIDNLVAGGILPAVHIGRCRRFRRDDVEAFVAGLSEQPAPGRPAPSPRPADASGPETDLRVRFV